MDKRQLKAFICVFEERNITRAAQLLNLTQPALSATIKLLEEELATTLFIRRPRGVEVTEDARVLYPQARKMLSDMQALVTRFRQPSDCLPLKIGVEGDVAPAQLAQLLTAIRQHFPTVLLNVEPGCVGDIRLACESLRCEDELFMPLFEEHYVLAYPASHALSQLETLTHDQLHPLPWVMVPTDESHQRLLPFYGAGAAAANAGSYALALDLAEAGFGVTIAPAPLVAARHRLAWRALPGQPLMRRVGICYAVQAQANPAVERVLAHFSLGVSLRTS